MSSQGIEDLLFATIDAVSRFSVGQREAVNAALEAGGLLTQAKGRLQHGKWGDWVHRVGLAPRTASMWMKLVSMDITADEIIQRGGIAKTVQGKSATLPISPDSNLDRDLVEAEAEIAASKREYYDALSRRNRALRAQSAREGKRMSSQQDYDRNGVDRGRV